MSSLPKLLLPEVQRLLPGVTARSRRPLPGGYGIRSAAPAQGSQHTTGWGMWRN